MEGLSPLRQTMRVTGEGQSALGPIGTFEVNMSFPRLLDWPTMQLICCVYENLSSGILMVSAFLKKMTAQQHLNVTQLPEGYLLKSTNYVQPSLTIAQANWWLKQQVYKEGRNVGLGYNQGLGEIDKRRRGLLILRKCIILVQVQAAITGFQIFY